MYDKYHDIRHDSDTVYFSTFPGTDTTQSFAKAMKYLREHPCSTLMIEPGFYTVTSELARWTQTSVMNGDFGPNPQKTMFSPKFPYTKGIDFREQRGSRIMAYGATLMVDGFMEPVSLNYCEDIEICGLTIDYARKPYSHGTVISIEPADDGRKKCLIEFTPEFSIGPSTPIRLRSRFYDPFADRFLQIPVDDYEYLDPCHLTAYIADTRHLAPGMEYYTIHTYHYRPAILIEHAKNITLTDVTIHSQPGMGIVGNRSENILIRRLSVSPSCGEHWSTNTDATHFTSIKGTLRTENCFSEGHGDDFLNVHGYYQEVVRRDSPTVCYLQEKTPTGTHAQTLDYPDPGDLLELTSFSTLQVLDTYRVTDCVPMHEEWMCKVTLDRPLPKNTQGLVFADVTRLPRLEVVGCTITSHYARSILVKTRNVLIERNLFKNALGMAVEIAAETWWYEGVGPADVTVRNNRIINCGEREAAGVVVKADADNPQGQSIFRITIENNIFDVPSADHVVYAGNTDGLTVRGNRYHCRKEPVVIKDCLHVFCDDGAIKKKGKI